MLKEFFVDPLARKDFERDSRRSNNAIAFAIWMLEYARAGVEKQKKKKSPASGRG